MARKRQRQRKDKRLGYEPEEGKEGRPRQNHAHGAALELGKPAQAVMDNGSDERILLRAMEQPTEAKA